IECVLQADEDGPVDVPKPISQEIDPEGYEIQQALERARASFKALEPPKPPPTLRRPDPLRVRTAGPTITPDHPRAWPHEFVARVARGEPIDGYLPPLKLQRIAAVASAPYYAARLRRVHFQEEKEEVKEFVWTENARRLLEECLAGSYLEPDTRPRD